LQELDAQLLQKHAADIDCKDATMGCCSHAVNTQTLRVLCCAACLQPLDPQLLKKHAADIDCKDATMGWTALHYAAASHNVVAAKQVGQLTRQNNALPLSAYKKLVEFCGGLAAVTYHSRYAVVFHLPETGFRGSCLSSSCASTILETACAHCALLHPPTACLQLCS
jgi:hypothetical protein